MANDKKIIPVGADFGNSWLKLCIAAGGNIKQVKLPMAYSFERPDKQILSSGKEVNKLQAFSLLEDTELWFGQDILSGPIIQKMDATKYDVNHIGILFKAGLYAWSQKHNIDLAKLGKLNVVTSMSPGAYANKQLNRLAESTYRKVFNRRQSHLHIAGTQVVTQFGGLRRETVGAIGTTKAKGMTLIVDFGSGTVDYALYNGDSEPIWAKSTNIGLAHIYADIDPSSPGKAELDALRNKKEDMHTRIRAYYSDIGQRIVMIKRKMAKEMIEEIILIGGGAAAMPPLIQAEFKKLAPKVIIRRDAEYQNALANWRFAGG